MIYLIDSGHGGIVNGKYVTAPAKMYTHPGCPPFYEGVSNRVIKKKLFERLDKRSINYFDLCPTENDISLTERVANANKYSKKYGKQNCIVISLHSNSGGGTGFEIFTSPGFTMADNYAIDFVKIFREIFPKIVLRMDLSDQDPDKEAEFTMLTGPASPAILPEFLFYDNYKDYKMLVDPIVINRYVDVLEKFCLTH